MVKIDNLTILACDCKQPLEAAKSLEKSCEGVSFAAVKLLTDTPVALSCGEVVQIPPITSWKEYSVFCWRELWKHFTTPFVLVVQHDSAVTHPELWSEDFLKFDYIGSVWDSGPLGQRVGNGGFSIRSHRLQKWIADTKNIPPYEMVHPEDVCLARHHRKAIDKAGFTFAPIDVANRFSARFNSPNTFGFHQQKNGSHKPR